MSADKDFAHLHVHSQYSVLDGINRTSNYPKVCKDLGMTSVAQTDHGVVTGHWDFYKNCRSAGIRPLLGLEAYYTLGSRHLKERDSYNRPYYHLVLLAMNNQGLHDLYKISTASYTEGFYNKPRIDSELLAQYGSNLIATSACLGSGVAQHILHGDGKAASDLLDHHAAMFKDRFFIELQPHAEPEQQKVNEVLIHLASKKNLPLVITADAHYTHKHEKHFHEVTLKMATGASSDDDAFTFGNIEVYLADRNDMNSQAAACSLPAECVSNTLHVSALINDADYFSDRMNRFPKFKSLPEGYTSWEYLESIATAGMISRFPQGWSNKYHERLVEELTVFKKLDMCDYVLITWEYLQKARELGVLTGPGRGSVGGSLVAYALGITVLDPIKYGLVFTRFLNEGRAGQPLFF